MLAQVLCLGLAPALAAAAPTSAPLVKVALKAKDASKLNATAEAQRLERIASQLTKVVAQPHAPDGASTVLADVRAAAKKLRAARRQDVVRALVRNATAEVLALQARLQRRFKELKAEDEADHTKDVASDKASALKRLLAIQGSLRKLSAKGGLEDGDAILRDVDQAVASVRVEKDPLKVQGTMAHLMAEIHSFQASLEAKMKEAKPGEAKTDKAQVLFDALYDIQDLPLKDQLAVVQKPEFKDLPETKQLLALKPTGDEPLAIVFGRLLDANAGVGVKKVSLKSHSEQESLGRIEHDILQHTNLTKERAAVLAPIVRELEGRLDRVEAKRQALQASQDHVKANSEKVLESAKKTKDSAAAQKANMVVKYLEKKTKREIQKKKASLDAEAKALNDAIAAIKGGNVKSLQAAMKRLGDLKGESQSFLH